MILHSRLIAGLFLFHIAVIALSNYLVQFPQQAFGIDFTWAMFTFPLVVLATDLTVRMISQKTAQVVVALAYVPAIIISVFLADWRIGLASGTAYFISQFFDISIFQKVLDTLTQKWWIAPLISTLIANVVDTYVFYGVAFHDVPDAFMAENWMSIAHTDLIFKTCVSIIIFLPLYKIFLSYLTKKAS